MIKILDAKLSYKGKRYQLEFKEEITNLEEYRDRLLNDNVHLVELDEWSEDKPIIYFTYEEE